MVFMAFLIQSLQQSYEVGRVITHLLQYASDM